ncbi:MAG: hypothetical protein PHS17_12440 [Desulfobacterales bacterium]|nr:hypothetical protein [Desulfobacterales bacterium]
MIGRQVFQDDRSLKAPTVDGHQEFFEGDVALRMLQWQMLLPQALAAVRDMAAANDMDIILHIRQKLPLELVQVTGVITCSMVLHPLAIKHQE